MNQPIYLLLASLGILLIGHGAQLSLLPLYASGLGWKDFEIGLTGSTYFLGFVIGCLSVPRMLSRVGHIRVFVCLSALAGSVLLVLETFAILWVWLIARFITGWCLAAIYTTTESWLNENADNHNRGKLLSIYVIVTLVGMAIGQVLLGVVAMEHLFTLSALLMVLAALPLGLFCVDQPVQLAPISIKMSNVRLLPLRALAGVFLGGVVTGSIWILAPVVGEGRGYSIAMIGVMMNVIIIGGAVMQLPVGVASDLMGRKCLIVLTSLIGAVSAISLFWIASDSTVLFMLAMFFVGGSSLTLYVICSAEAHDATPLGRIETSAILLVLNGAGSVVGPLIVGLASYLIADAFYLVTASSMALLFTIGLLANPKMDAVVLEMKPAGRTKFTALNKVA